MMTEGMDDKEDILSLSDYSINTTTADAAIPDELFRLESQSLNSIFYQDFEFVSQEWSITSATGSLTSPQENIIFCGKLFISSTQPFSQNTYNSTTMQDDLKTIKMEGRDEVERPKLTVIRTSITSKFSVDNIAVPASPREFRWYFLCGITRFPTEMALRDMKDRQSRKISLSSTLFGLGGGRKKEKKVCACKNEGQRQKGLFKTLNWHQIKLKPQCFSLNGEP